MVKTQAEHQANAFVGLRHQELLAHYQSQIQTVEKEIKKLVQAPSTVSATLLDCLTQIEGVRPFRDRAADARVPALNWALHASRRKSAAPGLAHDEEPSKRCIGGGRAQVRPVLYMAALSASRCNPVLAPFYQSLKKRQKLSKVALTAVMRKLVIHMNSKLKKLAAKPLNEKAGKSKKTKKSLAK